MIQFAVVLLSLLTSTFAIGPINPGGPIRPIPTTTTTTTTVVTPRDELNWVIQQLQALLNALLVFRPPPNCVNFTCPRGTRCVMQPTNPAGCVRAPCNSPTCVPTIGPIG